MFVGMRCLTPSQSAPLSVCPLAGLNIPVTEVVFENQRYYPWPVKWSAKLLPTDRKAWSDEQGLCEESRYGVATVTCASTFPP